MSRDDSPKRRTFLFQVDENICPFNNQKYCNHPLRTGDKFCKTYGNLNNLPDNCKLIEIETTDYYPVLGALNDIEDIARKSDDFYFDGWHEIARIICKIYGFNS